MSDGMEQGEGARGEGARAASERGGRKPLRLLVVMPSWVGDCVMATPALGMVRDALPGAFVGALMRPGLDELMAGTRYFDEVHVDRARGVMGPKVVAGKIRPRAYDTALLLTNSFSTALITRLAFIPRRVGYDRDARGMLLTDRLKPERRGGVLGTGGGFACVSAVEYYLKIARVALGEAGESARAGAMELGVTEAQERAAEELLRRAGVEAGRGMVVVNPGGNNPAKRWPAERFARLAAHVVRAHGVQVVVNGSPGESDLADAIVTMARHELGESAGEGGSVVSLVRHGVTLGALKGVVKRARVMVSNDTGPRHIAAALGVATVTLFGPTDPRWTTLPKSAAKAVEIVADPTLPAELVADDHPERCRVDRIEEGAVRAAVDGVLAGI